ncbi:hypothetical protein QR98_0058630 [Sarcoptes scabiei]|uniref:WH1 domain-containing protein n=1 Tax=Sarcoptes scabiei TaxID=52283 RepID=A0A132A8R1_SARSC|nr:hypothetical protein QR98_0058630 [Sarcoptes scabiei]
MAYRGRTLPPAPPPPLSPNSRSSKTLYRCQHSSSPSMMDRNFDAAIRSRSVSNISRASNSNCSADSATIASNSSGSSCNVDQDSMTPKSNSPTSRLLDSLETNRIEMFYRSHRTFVFVGQCLATLMFTETELVNGGRQSRPKSHEWKHFCIGVPVLLFNRGDTRSRDKRQIRICMAEQGTGFQLWSDVIDNLSSYKPLKATFHTMYLSTDHRKMAGLSFENQLAALEFYRQIEIIVANPLNISLTGPKARPSGEKFKFFRRQRSKSVGRNAEMSNKSSDTFFDNDCSQKYRQRNYRPDKFNISGPCLFQHVTSINFNNIEPSETIDQNHSTSPLNDDFVEFDPKRNSDPNIQVNYSIPFMIENDYTKNHIKTSSTSA